MSGRRTAEDFDKGLLKVHSTIMLAIKIARGRCFNSFMPLCIWGFRMHAFLRRMEAISNLPVHKLSNRIKSNISPDLE